MKKNITMFMPSIEGGGVEKNFFIVSNYLINFHHVSVITISHKYKKKFNRKIKFITYNLELLDKLSRRFKYFLALILLIKEIINSRNILVFCFQANIYTIIICKLFNVKIIIRSNSAPFGWSKNIIKKKIFRIVLSLADKIMVNSIDFKRDLKNEFKVNSVCIYNPLNREQIIKLSNKKINNIYKKNCLKIINVGRFVDQKNQIILLKALNLIKKQINFQAILIGRGILKKKMEDYINENNLNDLIKLINFKKNPFPYIKQADLFILTSSFEGLPNVLLESLVLNKYIISSNCRTGPREILLSGKGGDLFKIGDYKKLAKLIIDFKLQRKNKIKKLQHAKKNLFRFDYKVNLKKYLDLVNSLD